MPRATSMLLVATAVLSAGSAVHSQDEQSIERDLTLVANVTSGDVMPPGRTVETTLTLRNTTAEPLHFDPGEWESVIGAENTYLADADVGVLEKIENPVTLATGASRVVYSHWLARQGVRQPQNDSEPVRLRVTLRRSKPGGARIKSQWAEIPKDVARSPAPSRSS